MSTTDTRAAFEAQEKHNSSNLKRDDTGQYENPCTQSAWEGWQAALAWQAATEAAKPAQEEDSQIRWCAEGQIFGRPTATDALEYAEQRLRDPEEMSCCKSDIRLDAMLNVRELLSAAKATGTAGEIDADAEMAKVKRDVELMGVGFLVDGKRCSLDRITWFNRPGDTWLPPPPGYPTEAARQPAPVVAVSERDMMIAQAVRQACVNSYSPDDSASDYTEKMGDIDLATIIRAATNRSQP